MKRIHRYGQDVGKRCVPTNVGYSSGGYYEKTQTYLAHDQCADRRSTGHNYTSFPTFRVVDQIGIIYSFPFESFHQDYLDYLTVLGHALFGSTRQCTNV